MTQSPARGKKGKCFFFLSYLFLRIVFMLKACFVFTDNWAFVYYMFATKLS